MDDAKFRKHVSQLGTFRRALVAARRPRQTIVLRVAFHDQVIWAPSLEGVFFRTIAVVASVVPSSVVAESPSAAEYAPLHFLAKSVAMQNFSHADQIVRA